MNKTPDTQTDMSTAPHIIVTPAAHENEGDDETSVATAVVLIIGALVSLVRLIHGLTHSWTDGYLMRAEVAGMLQTSLAIAAGALATGLLIRQGRAYSNRHPLAIAAVACSVLALVVVPMERYWAHQDRDIEVTVIEIKPGPDKATPHTHPDTNTLV